MCSSRNERIRTPIEVGRLHAAPPGLMFFLKSSIEALSVSACLGARRITRFRTRRGFGTLSFLLLPYFFTAKSSWNRGWSWTCAVQKSTGTSVQRFLEDWHPFPPLSPFLPLGFPLMNLRRTGTLRPTQGEPCSLKDSLVQGLQMERVRARDFLRLECKAVAT